MPTILYRSLAAVSKVSPAFILDTLLSQATILFGSLGLVVAVLLNPHCHLCLTPPPPPARTQVMVFLQQSLSFERRHGLNQ